MRATMLLLGSLCALITNPARADAVKFVCPHPTYTEILTIDLDKSTAQVAIDVPGAGHPQPVHAEITENFIRFPSPNGQSTDTFNRLTGELTLGANGKRVQCKRAEKGVL